MTNSHASDAYQRFLASMVMDVGKWRDGIGYDLIALAELTESDRLRLAEQLARQSPLDWRDIEALAAIDRLGSQSGSHPLTQRTAEPEKSAQSGVKQSPSNVASECLRKALRNGDANCVLAISRFAPEIVSESSKIDALVSALQLAKFYEGLTEAIDEAAELLLRL